MAVVISTTTDARAVVATDLPAGRYVDWGPIIVGTLGALAIMVVLLTFGGALGLSITSAQPYAGLSAKALAVLAGLYAALVHVASFGAGGYLAGHLRAPWVTSDTVESHFRDGGHGFAVWALGVVLGAVFAVSGVSAVREDRGRCHHGGCLGGRCRRRGQPADPGCPAAALDATDRLCRRPPAGAGAGRGVPLRRQTRVARADLAGPIARAFAANMNNPQLDARDRACACEPGQPAHRPAAGRRREARRRGLHRAEGRRAEGARRRRQGA